MDVKWQSCFLAPVLPGSKAILYGALHNLNVLSVLSILSPKHVLILCTCFHAHSDVQARLPSSLTLQPAVAVLLAFLFLVLSFSSEFSTKLLEK